MLVTRVILVLVVMQIDASFQMNQFCEPVTKKHTGEPPLPTFGDELMASGKVEKQGGGTTSKWKVELFYTPTHIRLDILSLATLTFFTMRCDLVTGKVFLITPNTHHGQMCDKYNFKDIKDGQMSALSIVKFAFYKRKSLADVFRFGDHDKVAYIDTTRYTYWPKPLIEWHTCVKWANEYMSINSSLEDNNSTKPTNARPVTVVVSTQSSHVKFSFNEYKYRIPQIEDTFRLPRDVVCPGKATNFGLNTLGDNFYYEEEIIYPFTKTLSYNKVWFNQKDHLLRVDFRKNNTRFARIDNFNEGISFTINKMTGECAKSRLKFPLRDTQHPSVGQDGVVVMVNSLHFMGLDGSFYLQDEVIYLVSENHGIEETYLDGDNIISITMEYVNGIPCQVYRARRSNLLSGHKEAVFTYYFIHPNWLPRTKDGPLQHRVPVMLVVNIKQKELWYNYYNFVFDKPDYSAFNVKPCLGENDIYDVKFTFAAELSHTHTVGLQREARTTLSRLTDLDPWTIQDIYVTRDIAAVYLHASIHSAIGFSLLEFSSHPYLVSVGHADDVVKGVFHVDVCAKLCIREQKFACTSFDFCQTTSECRLHKSTVAPSVNSTGQCIHYSKIDVSAARRTAISQKISDLIKMTRQRNVTFSFTENQNKQVSLKAFLMDVISGSLKRMPMPYLRPLVSYRTEYRHGQDNVFKSKYIILDTKRNFFQITSHDLSILSRPLHARARNQDRTIVRHLHSAFQYSIDRTTGDCTVEDAQPFSVFDNPLYYTLDQSDILCSEQDTVRGVLCVTCKTLYPRSVGTTQPYFLIYLYHNEDFIDTYWDEMEGQTYLPMQLRGHTADYKDIFKMDMYDVATSVDLSTVDVSRCYGETDKKHVVITFSVAKENFTIPDKKPVILHVRDFVSGLRNVSVIRMARDTIETDAYSVHYSLTLLDKTSRDDKSAPSLDIVYKSLVNSVYMGTMNVSWDFDEYMVAARITSLNPQGEPINLHSALNMRRFMVDKSPEKSAKLVTTSIQHTALDECGTACVEHKAFDCQGFVYCLDSFSCELLPEKRVLEKDYHSSCSAFFKNYLGDYISLGETRGKTTGEVISVENDAACAKICSQKRDCEGFNFCLETQSCSLSKTRSVQVDLSTGDSICRSYTRNYMKDFIKYVGRPTPGVSNLVVHGVSPSECATRCVQSFGDRCDRFDFCTTQPPECHMFDDNIVTERTNKTVARPACDHYVRSRISPTVPTSPTVSPSTPTSESSSGSMYSLGTLVGVAVGMLVIGVIVITVVYFIVRKKLFASTYNTMNSDPVTN